ncbi:MAG TPA: hypothetical protein VD704_09525 [Gaiellaceae bacterium]|nr:hypothetical protein [Gaiellaceae bacterium]
MAENDSHAAWQNRYEVREGFGDEPFIDAGLRFETADFGAAVDFVFSFLDSRDPGREGLVKALRIVRIAGEESETVWSYSHGRAATGPADLTRVWGFDVTRPWSRAPRPHVPIGAGRLS